MRFSNALITRLTSFLVEDWESLGQDSLIPHLSPPSLHQRCLGLGEPECHLHIAVHLNRRG